jgi:hypothetical protein
MNTPTEEIMVKKSIKTSLVISGSEDIHERLFMIIWI